MQLISLIVGTIFGISLNKEKFTHKIIRVTPTQITSPSSLSVDMICFAKKILCNMPKSSMYIQKPKGEIIFLLCLLTADVLFCL